MSNKANEKYSCKAYEYYVKKSITLDLFGYSSFEKMVKAPDLTFLT